MSRSSLAAEDACVYSTSIERRCATDESGELRCETLKRTFRQLSGQNPEEISAERTQDDGGADAQQHGGFFTWRRGGELPFGHDAAGIEGMMRRADAMMSAMMGGGLLLPPRHGTEVPPPQQQAPSQRATTPWWQPPATAAAPPTFRVDEV